MLTLKHYLLITFLIMICIIVPISANVMNVYASQYPPSQSGTYVKATTTYDSGVDYEPWYTTDPSLSLTGGDYFNQWYSSANSITNQRFHVDLGSAQIITRIYYENSHNAGSSTSIGAKDFTVWGSNDVNSFNDLTYGDDTGWTQLTSDISQFVQHTESDSSDPQYVLVTNTVGYRYYAIKIADNWGSSEAIGLRRVEFQTTVGATPTPEPGVDPYANYIPPSISGKAPLVVDFTDISYNNPDHWNWSYQNVTGDNIEQWFSQSQNPSYSFNYSGNYLIRLNASNTGGSNITIPVTFVNVTNMDLPVADFNANQTSIHNGDAIQFYDNSTGCVTAWEWRFIASGKPDTLGAIFSTLQNPVQTFTYHPLNLNPGDYNIVLYVSNPAGQVHIEKDYYVNVIPDDVAPVSSFTSNVTSGSGITPVSFTDSSTNNPNSWSWTFKNVTGNNTQIQFSNSSSPVFNFNIGNYLIELNTSNSVGYNITPGDYFINITKAPRIIVGRATDCSAVGSQDNQVWVVNYGVETGDIMETHQCDGSGIFMSPPNYWGNWLWRWYAGSTTTQVMQPEWNSFVMQRLAPGGWAAETDYFVRYPEIIAGFASNVTTGNDITPVSFNDSSSGDVTEWQWSFQNVTGNNTQIVFSTSQNPVYTFGIGNYLIKLNAGNLNGSNVTPNDYFINISSSASSPVTAFSCNPLTGTSPLSVSCTDESTGSPTSWRWYAAPSGRPELRYLFSTEQNPPAQSLVYHQLYLQPGEYDIILYTSNAAGESYIEKDRYISMIQSTPIVPISEFSANSTSGTAPMPVQFTDQSQTDISEWNWSFGDGQYSNVQNPVHLYNNEGGYTVILTVLNASGVNDETKNNYISINGSTSIIIISAFTANIKTSSSVPATVSFYDQSSGPGIDSWDWSFGDGSTSTSQNPVHTYSSSGVYSVSLKASSSSEGLSNSVTYPQYLNIHAGTTTFGGYNFTNPGTMDIVNSSGMKDWLYYLMVTNKTGPFEFPVIGFATDLMNPFTSAFASVGGNNVGNIVYLILWGLFILMVWRQSGKITIPALIGCVTAGAWSLLFPESAQPWVLILLAAALASQLLTFFAKE